MSYHILPGIFGVLTIMALCIWRAYADAPMEANFKSWKEIKKDLEKHSFQERQYKWGFYIFAICFAISLLICDLL